MLRKKKYGYILLASLIVSGLAGTPTNNSLHKKERKYVAELMKETKAELFSRIKNLSAAQLNYRPAPGKWTIKECIYHIALAEKELWNLMETALKSAAHPEKRSELTFTDEQLVQMMEDRNNRFQTTENLTPKNTNFRSSEQALSVFKDSRAEHIKYLKNTTEDLRNHMVQLSFGTLDCYQLCLMIASHSYRHALQIDEIKSSPGFPR